MPSGERSLVEVLAEDAEAEGAGAGLFELLDLAHADGDGKFVTFAEDDFGVGGSGVEGAGDDVGGEGGEVGGEDGG
jgi:hypothetical protein